MVALSIYASKMANLCSITILFFSTSLEKCFPCQVFLLLSLGLQFAMQRFIYLASRFLGLSFAPYSFFILASCLQCEAVLSRILLSIDQITNEKFSVLRKMLYSYIYLVDENPSEFNIIQVFLRRSSKVMIEENDCSEKFPL